MSYGLQVTEARFWIERASLQRYLEAEACTLEAFLDDECWAFELDREGNVTDIEAKFEYQSGEVEDSLVFLAPYVRKGSYIEFEGEDGSTGRFDFDGKKRRRSGDVFASHEDEDED
jgi:hypothetical protein